GVNLSKSGLMDLAQILPPRPKERDFDEFIALFGDFLNYWLLRDLLISLQYITANSGVFGSLIKPNAFDSFVDMLRKQECWFGYLDPCRSFTDLYERVNVR